MPQPGNVAALASLLRHPRVWRAGGAGARGAREAAAVLPTGHAALDAVLPGGGWPPGVLVEILCDHRGIGELRLLAPALARLGEAGRRLVFVTPPALPYAPALVRHGIDPARVLLVRGVDGASAAWAAEQALRSPACGAVLLWAARIADRALRRLQLAAEVGGGLGVLFRSPPVPRSPAALRLALAPAGEALRVKVLKCRGTAAGAATVVLPAP